MIAVQEERDGSTTVMPGDFVMRGLAKFKSLSAQVVISTADRPGRVEVIDSLGATHLISVHRPSSAEGLLRP